METPINFINRLAKDNHESPEVLFNILDDYKFEILLFEEKFIKKIYSDALPETLSLAEKEKRAELYYLENFESRS